jgi:hypothetical protein
MLVSLVRFQSSAPSFGSVNQASINQAKDAAPKRRSGEGGQKSPLPSHDHMLKRLAVPVLLATFSLSACRNVNVVTASYATLEEARNAGAVSSGYLPDGLPSGTHDIREAHDPDTRRHWALFSFSPAEADHLRAVVGAQEVSVDGQACDVPGRIEWWPVLLRKQLDAERIRATGLRTYRSRSGDVLYAVNWSQGRAYLWTPDSR